MKFSPILLVCFVAIQAIAGHVNKKTLMFNSIRKCAKEVGVDFKTITHYLKGNFSNESKSAKCFLKCVANDMDFWVEEKPQKDVIMQYVDLLVKSTEGVGEILDKCIATDVSDDFCDHLHNVYKCFWTETKNLETHDHSDLHFVDNTHDNGLKKSSQ